MGKPRRLVPGSLDIFCCQLAPDFSLGCCTSPWSMAFKGTPCRGCAGDRSQHLPQISSYPKLCSAARVAPQPLAQQGLLCLLLHSQFKEFVSSRHLRLWSLQPPLLPSVNRSSISIWGITSSPSPPTHPPEYRPGGTVNQGFLPAPRAPSIRPSPGIWNPAPETPRLCLAPALLSPIIHFSDSVK